MLTYQLLHAPKLPVPYTPILWGGPMDAPEYEPPDQWQARFDHLLKYGLDIERAAFKASPDTADPARALMLDLECWAGCDPWSGAGWQDRLAERQKPVVKFIKYVRRVWPGAVGLFGGRYNDTAEMRRQLAEGDPSFVAQYAELMDAQRPVFGLVDFLMPDFYLSPDEALFSDTIAASFALWQGYRVVPVVSPYYKAEAARGVVPAGQFRDVLRAVARHADAVMVWHPGPEEPTPEAVRVVAAANN